MKRFVIENHLQTLEQLTITPKQNQFKPKRQTENELRNQKGETIAETEAGAKSNAKPNAQTNNRAIDQTKARTSQHKYANAVQTKLKTDQQHKSIQPPEAESQCICQKKAETNAGSTA